MIRLDLDTRFFDLGHPPIERDNHDKENKRSNKKRRCEKQKNENHHAVTGQCIGKGRARLCKDFKKFDFGARRQVVFHEDAFDAIIEGICVRQGVKQQRGSNNQNRNNCLNRSKAQETTSAMAGKTTAFTGCSDLNCLVAADCQRQIC